MVSMDVQRTKPALSINKNEQFIAVIILLFVNCVIGWIEV